MFQPEGPSDGLNGRFFHLRFGNGLWIVFFNHASDFMGACSSNDIRSELLVLRLTEIVASRLKAMVSAENQDSVGHRGT